MKTREQFADQISSKVASELTLLFAGMSAATISAILQFGASKQELEQMHNNVFLIEADQHQRIS